MTSSLTSDGTSYAEWRKFESTTGAANFNQGLVCDGIALAERTLAAMLATALDAGS